MKSILYPQEWKRYGRGSVFEFFANDENISERLQEAFRGTNFYIFSYFLEQIEKGKWEGRQKLVTTDDIPGIALSGKWKFLIGDENIIPHSAFEGINDAELFFYCNGLLELQYGCRTKKGIDTPSIGIVNKVINDDTNQIIEHIDHYRLFKSVSKKLKKYK